MNAGMAGPADTAGEATKPPTQSNGFTVPRSEEQHRAGSGNGVRRSVAAVVVEVADVVGPELRQRRAQAVALQVPHGVRPRELPALEGAESRGEGVADGLHPVRGGDVVQRIALQDGVGAGAAVGDVVLDADRPGGLVAQRVAAVARLLPERPDVVDRAGG